MAARCAAGRVESPAANPHLGSRFPCDSRCDSSFPCCLRSAAFAYISVPLADSLMQRWFVRDLDIRSSLIAATVQEQMATLVATRSEPRISAFFNRMLQDERLYGVGLCLEPGAEPDRDAEFPARDQLRVARVATSMPTDGQQVLQTPRGPLHVAVRPGRQPTG